MAFINNILKGSVCKGSGGVHSVYFISYDEEYYETIITNGVLTQLSATGVGVIPVTLMKVEVDTGNVNEALSVSDSTYGITQTLDITTVGISAEKLESVKTLIQQCRAIVHFNSGESRLYGDVSILDLTNISLNTGTSLSDATSVVLNFSGEETEFSPVISGSTKEEPLGNLIQATDYILI